MSASSQLYIVIDDNKKTIKGYSFLTRLCKMNNLDYDKVKEIKKDFQVENLKVLKIEVDDRL